jgi:hypothetical protein
LAIGTIPVPVAELVLRCREGKTAADQPWPGGHAGIPVNSVG